MINRQVKTGGPILGQGGASAEADNIIEESAYDSNGEGTNTQMNPQLEQQMPMAAMSVQPHLQHQVGSKKKKGSVSKGTKKKAGMAQAGFASIKTNNFMMGDQ